MSNPLRIIAAIILITSLAGCYNPQRAYFSCEYDIHKTMLLYDGKSDNENAASKVQKDSAIESLLMVKCMKGKGWEWIPEGQKGGGPPLNSSSYKQHSFWSAPSGGRQF